MDQKHRDETPLLTLLNVKPPTAKGSTFRIQPQSDLIDRIASFLPQLKQANEDTAQRMANGESVTIVDTIEAIEDSQSHGSEEDSEEENANCDDVSDSGLEDSDAEEGEEDSDEAAGDEDDHTDGQENKGKQPKQMIVMDLGLGVFDCAPDDLHRIPAPDIILKPASGIDDDASRHLDSGELISLRLPNADESSSSVAASLSAGGKGTKRKRRPVIEELS
ncbi:hypothetical protein BC830DRAFT_719047 [Chytriomyces sp. MP71]|nr:hypothetical protein BC830DRAFT_719047 [Chytriomyces sp. MP71]